MARFIKGQRVITTQFISSTPAGVQVHIRAGDGGKVTDPGNARNPLVRVLFDDGQWPYLEDWKLKTPAPTDAEARQSNLEG